MDKLEWLEEIGVGQFADVWKARDHLERTVAVKLVRPEFVDISSALTHAKALASAKHPNVVDVYYVTEAAAPGNDETVDCVVMELIDGPTLDDMFQDGMSKQDASRVITAMIDGLGHMHGNGICHGDIHEGNVMVTTDSVKIIDLLCRGDISLLSTASKETRQRQDLTSLRTLIEAVIANSEFDSKVAKRFSQLVSMPPTLDSIKESVRTSVEDTSEVVAAEVVEVVQPRIVDSLEFMTERLLETFPGVRGWRHFEADVAAQKLMRLLRQPLGFKNQGSGRNFPIWLWYGDGSLDISRCTWINPNTLLLNRDEIQIAGISVYNSADYHRAFVCVECSAMKPTGLYPDNPETFNRIRRDRGYVYEEYALYQGREITRAEFDDGYAEIDGESVETAGRAELRVRYLTPFRFLIAGQFGAINNSDFDPVLHKILFQASSEDERRDQLKNAVRSLPRNPTDVLLDLDAPSPK